MLSVDRSISAITSRLVGQLRRRSGQRGSTLRQAALLGRMGAGVLALQLAAIGLLGAGPLSGCGGSRPPGDPTRMSESEVDIAIDLWQVRGQPREALDHGLRAVELDPENADASHLVSLIYLDFCGQSALDECHLDEAEKHARRAVALRPDFLEAQNTLAVILVHQQRYDDAIALLEPITANILYRTPEIAWGNLGWAYLESGRPKRAIPALRKAVAAQPLFCVGNYRLGLAHARVRELQQALEAFDRALETDAPGCAALQDAYLERARVHHALGELEHTRADLDRCLSLHKSTPVGKECSRMLSRLQ
ncbi:MAG: tetratricopeptide repeat protein [Myxococcales bacterium]|nr:tetratricopeptide repeat protein [Myxococcales bacterium]